LKASSRKLLAQLTEALAGCQVSQTPKISITFAPIFITKKFPKKFDTSIKPNDMTYYQHNQQYFKAFSKVFYEALSPSK
jgi:hypothetical protein